MTNHPSIDTRALFHRTQFTTIAGFVLLILVFVIPAILHGADQGKAFGVAVSRLTDQADDWFKTDEGKQTVDNILTWQNPEGGWWKAYDASKPRPTTVPSRPNSGPTGDNDDVWHKTSTIDNNATWSELRVIARAARVLGDEKYKASFSHGLKYLFTAQYPNGGWPQRFPLQNNYGRHITYNDNAMLGVMRLLKDIIDQKPDFAFVSDADRKQAKAAFDKGIDCILNCQIKVNSKLTAWCQQHDEVTLAPAGARAYELPSISGSESDDLVLLLMDLDKPDQRVKDAVNGAVAWFESAKITGKRTDRVSGQQYENGRDLVVVDDPKAPPMWARFYDIETNKPFFCSRDGIKQDSIDKISHERRMGYAWYGYWPEHVLEEYPKWKERVK